jgi:hypothetical protein
MSKNNVRIYTDSQILDRIQKLSTFKVLPKEYYIVGIRSTEDDTDKFDDKFYIFRDKEFVTMTTGTTNPGKPVLTGGFLKYNKNGAAVVKSDSWYYDVWSYGMHMSKMPALLQTGPISVYRDGDKDGKAEEQGKLETGYFGINFHAATYDANFTGLQENIGGWSAGCQVINDKQKHLQIIALLKKQPKVSYVLLKEWEV